MRSLIKKIAKLFLFLFILKDYLKFKKKNKRFSLNIKDIYPCITDKTKNTAFERHYTYHTAWAARKLKEINPKKHIDISSSLHFSVLCSAFVPVDFYDYRPAKIILSNFNSDRCDLLNLKFRDNSIESISCMHTIEHVGLGRYGDEIGQDDDIKSIKEIIRVTKKGGSILFVTPVGKPKIRFNAHRIYSYEQIMEYFSGTELREFSLIKDKGDDGIIENANPALVEKEDYGCGCFWFIKK